jgi:PAS domain S-box-containing protein
MRHRNNTHRRNLIGDALQGLQTGRWFWSVDLALVVTAILLIFTEATVFLFHVIFILLTVGAFFWNLRAFALRAGIWVTITSAVVLSAILVGRTPAEELGEIPLLTIILLVVFGVARQRARAEEALRKANDELENRVAERTAELTLVNAELIAETAQHKRTAETLQESEERYRRLVELSFEAIAIHRQGKFIYINPAGARLLGAESSEELIGRSLREFVHPDYWDLVQARLQKVRGGATGVPLIEEKFIRLDGTLVDVEVASVPITYEGETAVQTVIHDISARKQAEVERQRERARIARNLHDSLGHSLGYLHLKLDQLTGSENLGEAVGPGQELAQMRDVANEAYELVRGMLAASLPSATTDLATALLVRARAVGQRGNFRVQLSSEGESRPLPPIVQQQILYFFQEALFNVERHANAQRVDINLLWGEDDLTIELADDGRGFEADALEDGEHYGLRIMQERAREMNGQLTLTSRPGVGAQVTLRLPLDLNIEGVTAQ